MKMIWVQFMLAEKWDRPQGWKRFGWTWNYIKCFNKKLLIVHGWGTIETINKWLKEDDD
jgi:hypothetical protein